MDSVDRKLAPLLFLAIWVDGGETRARERRSTVGTSARAQGSRSSVLARPLLTTYSSGFVDGISFRRYYDREVQKARYLRE
jgi:hypothetical protein